MTTTDGILSFVSSEFSNHRKSGISMELSSYKMDRKNLGCAYIFNNENFHKDTELKKREGSQKDADALHQLFTDIGFTTVKTFNDLNQIKALTKLTEISAQDFSDDSCFLAVFLSHGDEETVKMHKGQLHIQNDILTPFRGHNCKTLSGKPKIFIFQACRGDKTEEAAWDCDKVDGMVESDASSELVEEEGVGVVTPSGADFVVCYAAANGKASTMQSVVKGEFLKENINGIFQAWH